MNRFEATEAFLFQGLRLDRRGLFRLDQNGQAEPVALGSRALELLRLFANHEGELLPKDKIMEAVWPGMTVEESNLTVQVSALRRALDQADAQGSCIQTIPGRGYRFVAAVTRGNGASLASLAIAPHEDVDGPAAAAPSEQWKKKEGGKHTTPVQRFSWRIGGILGMAILAVGIAATVWNWRLLRPGRPQQPPLSIMVLPFADLSVSGGQQYFADAVTEDLTTDLSRLANSFVISASTARTYEDKPHDAKRIGQELGIHYVLEGSIERSGDRVRINAQLIDAEADAHLWAERFDRNIGDLLALQDEITGRIANALDVALIRAEAERPAEPPDALNHIFRGRTFLWRPQSRNSYAQAVSAFEQALAIDPHSAEAQSLLAIALIGRVLSGMSDNQTADLSRAEKLVGQALSLAPNGVFAHFAEGQLLRTQHRCGAAIPEYEAVLAINRNSAAAIARMGYCKLRIGSAEEAISLLEKAILVSPRDPQLDVWYFWIGQAYLLQSHIDEAVAWFEKARDVDPGLWFIRQWLAAAYGLKDDREHALAELAESRRLSEHNWPTSIAQQRASHAVEDFETPAIRASLEATYLVGLRKAGVPEQ